jgi:hypothetical protein
MTNQPRVSVPTESRPTAREVATWILSNCAARYVKPEGFSQSPQDVINFQIHMAEVKIEAYAASSSLLPVPENGLLLRVLNALKILSFTAQTTSGPRDEELVAAIGTAEEVIQEVNAYLRHKPEDVK